MLLPSTARIKIGFICWLILALSVTACYLILSCLSMVAIINEPRREKTGLRGFRPGPTQTGLYKLRKELDA